MPTKHYTINLRNEDASFNPRIPMYEVDREKKNRFRSWIWYLRYHMILTYKYQIQMVEMFPKPHVNLRGKVQIRLG